MTNRKIAMFSFHTCPLASFEGKQTGGMNVYVLELSRELAKRGFRVDIFTRSQDKLQPEIVEFEKNLRVIHLKAGPQRTVPKKSLIQYVPDFVDNFNKFITEKNLEYDIFHCHYYLSGLAARLIKKTNHQSVPFVITFHTLALMKNLVARSELEREEKERTEAEKLLIKVADKIIAPSESDGEYLQYLYEAPLGKISVISPGVSGTLFKPVDRNKAKQHIGADLNHKIVLFVGRIEPLKGIDVLMYAIKILLRKNPDLKDVCLWIVGGDVSGKTRTWSEEMKKLENLRRTLNLSTSVKFIGQVLQKELLYYYNASELVVIPSHYESFGIAALEAMSCGVPVIITNVAGITDLLDKKHQALITSSNNPLLLSSQIEHLLTNSKEHERLSREVLSKVQDLNWGNISEEIIKVYNELL